MDGLPPDWRAQQPARLPNLAVPGDASSGASTFCGHGNANKRLVEEAAREIDEAVVPDDLARGLDSGAGAAALADLSPAHREVLLLRYQEDMSYAQIAIVVGSSVGTIRSRLHHAKRRLQEAMARRTREL